MLELVWALASFGDGKATCAVDSDSSLQYYIRVYGLVEMMGRIR